MATETQKRDRTATIMMAAGGLCLVVSLALGVLGPDGWKPAAQGVGLGAVLFVTGLVVEWFSRRAARPPKPAETEEAHKARQEVLLDAGVPAVFLDLVRGIAGRKDDLRYLFGKQDIDIRDFTRDKRLSGWSITPVYASNDTQYVLLLERDGTRKFVSFDLGDGLGEDYGSDFNRVLADIIIELYEFSDETPVEDLKKMVADLGCRIGSNLLDELEGADRDTFEKDRVWRAKRIPELLAAAD